MINPGNPTGNILAEEQIKDIIQVNTQETGMEIPHSALLASYSTNITVKKSHGDTPHCPVNIFTLVQMAVDEKMVVLADEVYQANIWKKGASFSSFKKVSTML